MAFYIVKFIFRIAAFAIMIGIYINDREKLYRYSITPIWEKINFMHVMWAVFMVLMISHIFPTRIISMGAGKIKKSNYIPIANYSEAELMKYVHNENKKSWNCMIWWIVGNAAIGILYYLHVISESELILITGFYFISDYVCILVFCPFQSFGHKARCCVNCRIYDWGHFFMFTPMLFIQNFFSQSLFIMGTVVIVHWEYLWLHHPERFWAGSNAALSCLNCHDKTCKIKKPVTKMIMSFFKK